MADVIINRALVVFANDPDGNKRRQVVMHWVPPGLLAGIWWMKIEGIGRFEKLTRQQHLDRLCVTLDVSFDERQKIGMEMIAIEQQESI